MNASEVNYCPRCGTATILSNRFGKVRPNCPNCDWIYFSDPKVAVVVFIYKADKVLLIRRANDPQKGLWTMPGGFMDAGEDPRLAAERECAEETGLKIRVKHLLDIASRPAKSQGAHLILYFEGEYISGALQAGDDADRVSFFGLNDLPPLAFESAETIHNLLFHKHVK
jgi:ADP-ribose pyrophosphatase YjhB (NUDIX family)